MADYPPELQHMLAELERELEVGSSMQRCPLKRSMLTDSPKRRMQLLSQYQVAPSEPNTAPPSIVEPSRPQTGGGLKIHSPDSSSHPASTSHRLSMAPQPDFNFNPDEPLAGRPDSSYSARRASYSPSDAVFQAISSLRPGVPMTAENSVASRRDSLFLGTGLGQGIPNVDPSRAQTMISSDYAFNPDQQQPGYGAPMGEPQGIQHQQQPSYDSHTGTMDSQAFFPDFAGQQGNEQGDEFGAQRYSTNETFSPSAAMAPPMLTASDLPPPEALDYQMPLEPRDVPFAIYDPHDLNEPMSKFDNIATVLRYRGRTNAKLPAYWVLDSKGKEIGTIAWDKLASRAEKVAQVIRDKSTLYKGDRVALIYRDTEVIDFAIALLGCFIAGVVAVPINDLQDYQRLNMILTSTQAHLALTTDTNLKMFQRDINMQKLTWPKGVEWWKTNDFGSFHPKKKEDLPALQVPDLAYIEFSRGPTGDHRGVVLSHRTIMHQMACFSAITSTVPKDGPKDTFNGSNLRDRNGKLMASNPGSEILLTYLDPRHGIGMILGVLYGVYGGHTTVWMESKAIDVPGLYAHLITKYKATLMVADYSGLNKAVSNYQTDPMSTRNYKKGMEPNFQTVKLCLIDTLTVNCEFHEVLADRWLRPLRNTHAREVVAPMLCLPEHGGMVISVRDWVGGEERMGVPLKLLNSEEPAEDEDEKQKEREKTATSGFGSLLGGNNSTKTESRAKNELGEVLLDREALKSNEVVVVAIGDEARKEGAGDATTIRVGAFGYPIPDATLAVVNPETGLLASSHSIGEIWVDSPSLSGGFWALPKHTEHIFHARPYKFDPGNPTPTPIEPEFLRTGLLGTVIEGKVFVLGLYEDRIRQKVEWVEHGTEVAEHRYFFVQHLVVSIIKNMQSMVYDCSAFDVYVNEEHLPILVVESSIASTAPTQQGGAPKQLDPTLLDSLAEKCMEILMQEHHLRLYCVMISPPNSLPRVMRNGRREIGNMLCRRDFDLGNLPCAHVRFGVEHAVLNLPIGVDPTGGIWSPLASSSRADILMPNDKQYSGIDKREVVMDDSTSTPLNNFMSITDLIQWRVARQPEELAFCTIDSKGREGKGITWKKFDMKVAAVAIYLRNKVKVKAGDHIILMYTHSEEFVFAVHACISLGLIIIPLAPLDQNRLREDVPALLHLVSDYKVKAMLVNQEVDHLLKMKVVASHIKQSASIAKINLPNVYNTTKPPRQNSGSRELGLTMNPAWVQPGWPVIIWTYWTPDQRRIAVQLGHDTILGMCKVQKETCQMSSKRPVLGCVRSTSGLGFLHSIVMGIYVGAPTYLLSPLEFAQQPLSLFISLSRYKIKDTYATPQMLDHAMASMTAKGFTLHEMKNMMISSDGRPRVDVFQKVRLHFAATSLDRTAINTVYSHVLNPMIASRSYMCIEPIELWLDTRALRRGLVIPLDPGSDTKSALLVQDSGMVPVSTQIAIVNPESCLLCHEGEYGEIWVDSEACVKAFYGSTSPFDVERFNGRTVDGDPSIAYVRTGDLGFLHSVSRPIGPGGALVDMQVLFVLGNIGETFDINGLSHFPMDIEASIERSHRRIVPGGCAVFQAGGLVVVLAEVPRSPYLASIVPVIVNAVLSEHQIIVDIVAFVEKGSFPRSRLGEKQRGKILGGWIKRTMPTLAQFAIRSTDPSILDGGPLGADAIGRSSMSSFHSGADQLSMANRRMSMMSVPSSGRLDTMRMTQAPPMPQMPQQVMMQQHQQQQMPQQQHYPDQGQYQQQYQQPQQPQQPQQQYAAQPQQQQQQQYAPPAQQQQQQFDLRLNSITSTQPPTLPGFDFGLGDSSSTNTTVASVPANAGRIGSAADQGAQQKQQQHSGGSMSATLSGPLPSIDGREALWLNSGNPIEMGGDNDWSQDAIRNMHLAGDMK
ncbi:hypothetical protein TD95_000772 [Thielaviopsis punctulata]|uniref:DMAP1-binding domain-containing protein n=1 Tax=Thielaviopsis punctulata TaxID=72032 RepID=A0A0F4Z920_9PEZI|nr:hypothetical protein TD95_000772 [Thielaviopsis punctulata]